MIKTHATISHIEYSPSGEVAFVRFKPHEKFTFQEWQFVMIESTFDHPELGKPLKKPYSIATTNQELQTEGTLWVIVKKTLDGYMSDFLTKWITVGTELVITWPVGHMTDDKKYQKYLLVSTGSGISPMVALYSQLITDPDNMVANIFGERFHKHILPSVEQLFTSDKETIKHTLFLSQEDHDGYRRWHVQEWLDEALAFLGDKSITVFLCGSPVMVDDMRQLLTERWFDKEQIKFEKY